MNAETTERITIDPHLIAGYTRMAVDGQNFRGMTLLTYAAQVHKMVRTTGAKTLLDYGSGWGDCWGEPYALHRRWGIKRPELYDPAIPALRAKPDGHFHGVICCDVLEHIPERHVEAVIEELFAYATRFVWASVCCRPAKKVFPETAVNLHVTVQPFDWWRRQFGRAGAGMLWRLTETA